MIRSRPPSAFPKRQLDSFQNDIVDFSAFLERGLPQSFMHRFGQVKTGVNDPEPWLPALAPC
jgi:hypothetical protein